MDIQLPFIGRTREIATLQRLYAQRKHALIFGVAGMGKSALIAHLRTSLRLCVCPKSERLNEICEALEQQLGLSADELRLIPRKNRVLNSLKESTETVVFDGAGWTTPRICSFIARVGECVPVWLCVRSEHPWDVGHIWPLLARFERVELKPFQRNETQMLIASATDKRFVSRKTLEIADWLHRQSGGNPKILREMLAEIAHGHYDLNNPYSLRRLDLDRRIHEMFPVIMEKRT